MTRKKHGAKDATRIAASMVDNDIDDENIVDDEDAEQDNNVLREDTVEADSDDENDSTSSTNEVESKWQGALSTEECSKVILNDSADDGNIVMFLFVKCVYLSPMPTFFGGAGGGMNTSASWL